MGWVARSETHRTATQSERSPDERSNIRVTPVPHVATLMPATALDVRSHATLTGVTHLESIETPAQPQLPILLIARRIELIQSDKIVSCGRYPLQAR